MIRAFPIALVIACSAPARPPVANVAPQRAPLTIAGDHHAKHTIGVVCDRGWCDEQVEDQLTIREARNGAIAVAIALVQTNAHSCTFEGELAPSPAPRPNVRRWKFAGMTDDGPCELSLDWTDRGIELSAAGCRYYCGARASLDAAFPL